MKNLFLVLLITIIPLNSIYSNDKFLSSESLLQGSLPVEGLINLKTWGTTKVISKNTTTLGTSQLDIVYANGQKRIFLVTTTKDTKKIYETDGLKRSIILDNSVQTIKVQEKGITVNYDPKTWQDISVATVISVNGDLDTFNYVSTARCSNSFFAAYPRKSQSVAAVQNFATSYLAAHKDCKQVGGIDTGCLWGDLDVCPLQNSVVRQPAAINIYRFYIWNIY